MSKTENSDVKPKIDTAGGPFMRHQLERYRLLVENSRDVVVEVSDSGHVLYVSPNAKDVLGYEPADLFHTRLLENVHPDDLIHVRKHLHHPEGMVTCRYRHRDGSWRWLETTGREFITSDTQVHCVLVVRDVSERKRAEGDRMQLETRLRQIHKMESIGTLAGGIAHDFNNLLTVIIGCTELAIMDAHCAEEAIEHLMQVKKASRHAKELVQQILTFSRKQKQERKPLRLQPVINDSLELMRHTLPSTIEIIAQVDPDAPLVLADITQIHQVMINLCTNAAHAMRERPGQLTVSLNVCEPETVAAKAIPNLSRDRYVLLSISDTGHGMNAETVARIFEPFFTTKDPNEGTGLGMSVVQGIVNEHQGAISVQSQPGVGTTVQIHFPALDGAPIEPERPSMLLPRGDGEHILLVDDEPAVCDSLRVLLNRLGYRVTAMNDPVEALKAFREKPDAFNLLISDLTMPHMTGVDLIHQLLEIRPSLPTVLSSGSSEATHDHVKRLGVSELLSKPASLTTLANVVHKALGGKHVNG